MALIPVVLSAWVYYPITGVYFFADDFNCLLSIANDGFLRFVLRPFGGHNLLVRNLALYGSYQAFGLNPQPYFWTVLLTHLVNVYLLFRVLRQLTGSRLIACFGATLWGTSPVNLGTLGWYSVFGHALAGTVLLVVLAGVTRHSSTGTAPSAREASLWYVLLLLGTTCFGTGVGVALAFPVVLFLVLPAAWQRPGMRLAFLALPALTVAGYFAYRHAYDLVEPLSFPEVLAGSLSPARVWSAVPMLRKLLGVSLDAALHSFFFLGDRHPGADTAITWALLGAGLIAVLLAGTAAIRRATLAMIVLWVGVYFVIALGRQPFEDSEAARYWLAAQVRYHYLGVLPVVTVACLCLAALDRIAWLRAVPRFPLLLIALVIGVVGYQRSTFSIDKHDESRAYFASVLDEISVAVAQHPPGATVLLENPPAAPLGPTMVVGKVLFPGRAAVFLLQHPGDDLDGRRVRFIERDPRVLAWQGQWPDAPLTRLLVAPTALPQ